MKHFSRLIVPVDGSTAAGRGVAFAAQLANTEGAAVDVCSVVDEIAIILPLAEGALVDPAPMMETVEAAATDNVAGSVRQLRDARIEARGTVLRGEPAAEIDEFARRQHADAIVLGTNGRGGIDRMFMGSVTLALLHTVDVPLVTVHADDTLGRGPIVVAIDASPASVAALECAIERARNAATRLQLLHVLDENRLDQCVAVLGLRPRSARRQALTDAEDALDAAAERVRAAGVSCTAELQRGTPVESIVIAASRAGCQGIAIGTHGRGMLERFILGSVADGVIRGSRVPVYVVRRRSSTSAKRGSSTREAVRETALFQHAN